MNKVVVWLAAGAAVVAMQGSARAQSGAAYNWTGFYAGLNFGAAAGHIGTPASDNAGSYPSFSSLGPQQPISTSSAVGGGQAGYDYQLGWAVIGVETDFQYGSGSSKTLYPTGDALGDLTSVTARQNWFGTVRPRIGIAATNPVFFPYLTAGLAYGSINDTVTETRPAAGVSTRTFGTTQTKLGWVAGLGAEIPVTFVYGLPLVGGIEYLHTEFGTAQAAVGAQTLNGTIYPSEAINFRNDADVFRIRVDYRF